MKKLKRHGLAVFLNIAQSGELPDWQLIGDGYKDLRVTYNKIACKSDIEKYAPVISMPLYALRGGAVFQVLSETQETLQAECLLVYVQGKGGIYAAEKNKCRVQIEAVHFLADDIKQIFFSLALTGSAISGRYNAVSKTFLEGWK